MKRFLLALLVLGLLNGTAEAGRRCWRSGYSYGYTLRNSYCWPQGCWSCHPRKSSTSSYNWREAITTIEKQKVETNAFLQALQTISPQPQAQQYGYQAYGQAGGYAMPYGTQTYGEYASYPQTGNTLYGAAAYLTPPSVNVDATAQTLLQLSGQMNNGASQLAVETKGLVEATSAAQERVQTRAMAIQALMELSRPQPATQQTLRWQSYQGPVQPQPAPPQPQAPVQPQPAQGATPQPSPVHQAVATIFNNDCVQCHSPQGKWGVQGTFDITALTTEMLTAAAKRTSLPEDDPKRMPKTKTADGFGPGRVLSFEEQKAIQDLALGVQQ